MSFDESEHRRRHLERVALPDLLEDLWWLDQPTIVCSRIHCLLPVSVNAMLTRMLGVSDRAD